MTKRVVARDNQILGAYDEDTLLALLNGGTLKLTDQYWDARRSEWRPLMDYLGKTGSIGGSVWWRILGHIRFGRLATMLISAACGAAVTWLILRPPEALKAWIEAKVTREEARPATTTPPAEATDSKPAASPVPPKPAAEPAPKSSAPPLEIVSVEDLGDEVAITLHNTSDTSVSGIAVRLLYHPLPAGDRPPDRIEADLEAAQARLKESGDKASALAETIESLERILRLISTDVVTWTPGHIKAIPSAEQWKSFGNLEIEKAGSELIEAASVFSSHVTSSDPDIRKQALTEDMLALAKKTEELKPMLLRLLAEASKSRTKIEETMKSTGGEIESLKAKKSEMQGRRPVALAEAGKNVVRSEVVRLEATIESGLVKRVTVERDRDPRLGVTAELVAGK